VIALRQFGRRRRRGSGGRLCPIAAARNGASALPWWLLRTTSGHASADKRAIAFVGAVGKTNVVRDFLCVCHNVTILGEPFRSRRTRSGRLCRFHEVSQNGHCEIRTTGLVCPTATWQSDRVGDCGRHDHGVASAIRERWVADDRRDRWRRRSPPPGACDGFYLASKCGSEEFAPGQRLRISPSCAFALSRSTPHLPTATRLSAR
jgi:hypothetical protein